MRKTILSPVGIGCNGYSHGLLTEIINTLFIGIPSTFGAVGE
jgi:hypothetical protein